MPHQRFRRPAFAFVVLFVLLGIPASLLWRQIRHERLDKALVSAVRKGNVAEVQTLLTRGADPNANVKQFPRDGDAEAELTASDAGGWIDAIKRLFGIRPHVGRVSILFVAAAGGKPEVVEALLNHGAEVNVGESRGRTPLLAAATRSSSRSAELLLNKGADVNATDRNGMTALIGAAMLGSSQTVKLLLDHGADVHAQMSGGMTALKYAEQQATLWAGLSKLSYQHNTRPARLINALSNSKRDARRKVALLRQAGAKE